MTGFFGRKTVARSQAQRAVSKMMMTSALVAVGSLAFASASIAADYEVPTGATVVGGAATFAGAGANNENLIINQSTNRVVINWNTFNIGADASVEFKQLGSDSLAVNRVKDDGQFSRINGRLTANGQVMILDPNGIIFGGGSVMDVGGIIASTGDIDVDRVMAGDLAIRLSNFGTGQIVNQGTINAADSGLVAFVASTVKNNGVINANLGRVALAAGTQTMTVDLYGDGLVELAADSLVKSDASFLSENTGEINAVGGKIQMTAATAKNVVDSVVNMQGVLRASSASVKANGSIVLSAGKVVVGSKPTVSTGKYAAKAKLVGVTGDTKINGQQLDLGLTIDGKVSGAVKTVNVLSDAAKIAQGLDAVATNGTVNVAAGTYNEHLVVDKVGVTLRGAVSLPADPTADRVVGETIVNPNSPGVTVAADNVTIDGLTFSGAAGADGYGIFVNNADNVTLKNNTITNTSQSGIYVLDSDFVKITNNNIGATGAAKNIGADGVYLNNADGALVSSNIIANTTSPEDEVGSGVYAKLSNDVSVENNTIYNTGWDGVKVADGNNYYVANNIIHNNNRAGVAASGTTASWVVGNNINDTAKWGVWVTKNDGLMVASNTISGTGRSGVLSYVDTNTTIQKNTITNANLYGVLALDGAGIKILTNNIGAAGSADNINGDGVYLGNVKGADVSGNEIANTKSRGDEIGSGVYAKDSQDVKISNNVIGKNGWDGIKIANGTNYVVTGNKISDTTRAGIAISDTVGSVLKNNNLNNLSLWGVWSSHNSGMEISGNTVKSSKSHGIYSDRDENAKIDGNIVAGTNRNGIHVQNSAGTLDVTNNNVGATGLAKNIKGDGIHLYNANGANVSGNTIGNIAYVADEIGSGVYAENSNNVSIHHNTIRRTGWDGVKVVKGDHYNIYDNTISFTARAAVAASETTNSVISGNVANNMTKWGIWSNLNQGLEIVGNSLTDTGRSGILSYQDKNITINSNSVTGAKRDGINVQDVSGVVTINSNTVTNSADNGIYVGGYSPYNYYPGFATSAVEFPMAAGLFINENNVSNSGDNGIFVEEATGHVEINANQIAQSGRDGVHVEDYYSGKVYIPGFERVAFDGPSEVPLSSDLNIIGNKISKSQDDGVEVAGSTGSINVSGNEIRSSGANGVFVHGFRGEIPSETFAFAPFPPMYFDYVSLNVNKNLIVDSNNGISLESINGDINVLGNDIRNSNYNGVVARYVNQYGIIDGPMLLADGGDELPDMPVTQLTISNNNIDNSGDNGIALYNVGGDVTVGGNRITDSGYNGVVVRNYGFDIPTEEVFAKFRPFPGSNPIQLRLVENVIENIGFVPEGGEGSEGSADKLFAEVIAEGNFPSDYKPQGFAAVNLDISSQGTAEVSGNTLGNNFDYGLVAYSGTIDLTGAKNTIQNTKIGMGFYPTEGTPEADNPEYFAYLANKLKLVNNTIGSTDFINQSELFVDLGYGAFFAPDSPTVINGNDASYTVGGQTISPSTNGGNVTSAEYDVLENFLNHYVDAQNRGLFFFNIVDPVDIEQNDVLRTISFAPTTDSSGSLTITGLPRVPGAPLPPANQAGTGNAGTQLAAAGGFDPNAIEPAAGEEAGNTGDVADIQPAAGAADASSCWADATQSLGQGSAVTVNFGTAPSALLQDTANCGNGGAQAL